MGDACTPLYNEKYHTLPPASFMPLASSPFLHPVGWRDGREVGVVVAVVVVVVVVVRMFFLAPPSVHERGTKLRRA
jgi:dolichyl-phosphate-mannose--protein O-mannosyl transferase